MTADKDRTRTIAERLERCFAEIGEQRMVGIPILNDALSVRSIGMGVWQDHWLCVLVTPWFMNVMLLPQATDDTRFAVGAKRIFHFPAGPFEFIRGHESAIGPYWMCSLFSPVLEFADEETAEATAAAALDAMLADADGNGEADRGMAMIWRGELPEPDMTGAAPPAAVSRRALLTGLVAEEDAQ